MNLDVSPGPDAAIERLCELIAGAAPRSLVLTGGTTAGAAYDLLASEAWRTRLDWSRVTLYFGDERRVPPDDEGSCYRLVTETLLRGVTPAGVERMRGEEPDGDAEADRYGALLPERLDVTLLSMGEDGHCASLFPGSPQLAEREQAVHDRAGAVRAVRADHADAARARALAARADPRARRAQARGPRAHPRR